MTTFLKLLRPLVFGVMALSYGVMAQAPGDVRIALVIGNGAYSSVTALANPVNDAKAMAQTLKKLGFVVIELRDGSKEQMTKALADAKAALQGKQGIGMLYYAGHGLQVNEHNFMVPVDAKMSKAADVPKQSVDVGDAIQAFKNAGNRMNILVLDACRDNPFGTSSDHKGLAPIDAPAGTILAYATAPGNVAEDGDAKSANGLYTSYLLQEIVRPQARIEDVFKRVRYLVRQKSQGRQIPWESTSLEEDFIFSDGRVVAPERFTPETAKTAYEVELEEWNKMKGSKDAADYFAVIARRIPYLTKSAIRA